MKLRLLLILILILTISDSVIFSQDKKQTVAVLEFNSNSRQIGKDELATLTSRFRTMLVKTDAFDVLERQKMSDILKEQNFTISDNCNSAECAVQVGQLLGVELMIAGDVGKLGDTYSVDLRLISVSTGKITQTESQDHEGKIDGLFGTLTTIANSFAGIKSNTSSAETQIAADGTFTDPRDGKKYKTVKIGNQIWMAENLNYDPDPLGILDCCYCYDDNQSNCDKYGRLYTWEAAKKAVPPGWHLPTRKEWKELLDELEGSETDQIKLQTSTYQQMILGGMSGFDALFGGFRGVYGVYSNSLDRDGFFWSSSESEADCAWSLQLSSTFWEARLLYDFPNRVALSVRCVKD